ncbi:MAG: hypothetical protein INQ03_07665 [Candidatus Heimdallarchaeota archaeon]|nr:hypothetical protein [Candidatus Heimdallarchaeota archaeon]
MSDDGELMLNRLIVLLQIVAIPIYFIYFTIKWHEDILLFFDILLSRQEWLRPVLPEWMVVFLANFGIPIFFSFPWLLVSILRATRIADAYSLMGRALGKVRIDQKIFYGLNAAFTLIFFVLPFGSPLITLIGIFVAMRMMMRKLLIGKISKLSWIIPSLILSFYPGLIVFAFYTNYLDLIAKILVAWSHYISTIFGIGLCLAISISLGNLLLFFFEGRAKYNKYEAIPEGFVLVMKAVFMAVLCLLYFNGGQEFVNYVNYFAVGAAFFEMIMRRMHDLNTESNSARGIIMVIVFSLVNMLVQFLGSIIPVSFIQSLVIIISGLLFFALFSISYKYADDPELF